MRERECSNYDVLQSNVTWIHLRSTYKHIQAAPLLHIPRLHRRLNMIIKRMSYQSEVGVIALALLKIEGELRLKAIWMLHEQPGFAGQDLCKTSSETALSYQFER